MTQIQRYENVQFDHSSFMSKLMTIVITIKTYKYTHIIHNNFLLKTFYMIKFNLYVNFFKEYL